MTDNIKGKIMNIETEGSTVITIGSPITIKDGNKVLEHSKGNGAVYFKNRKDYEEFLSYVSKTYADKVINPGVDYYSFTSNTGTQFRLLITKVYKGTQFSMQSWNGRWNW